MYNVQKIGKYEIEVVAAVIMIKLRDYFWLFLLLILREAIKKKKLWLP